jgi:hypothetical protein
MEVDVQKQATLKVVVLCPHDQFGTGCLYHGRCPRHHCPFNREKHQETYQTAYTEFESLQNLRRNTGGMKTAAEALKITVRYYSSRPT